MPPRNKAVAKPVTSSNPAPAFTRSTSSNATPASAADSNAASVAGSSPRAIAAAMSSCSSAKPASTSGESMRKRSGEAPAQFSATNWKKVPKLAAKNSSAVAAPSRASCSRGRTANATSSRSA